MSELQTAFACIEINFVNCPYGRELQRIALRYCKIYTATRFAETHFTTALAVNSLSVSENLRAVRALHSLEIPARDIAFPAGITLL